jgi:hypothetical protein
MVVNESLDLRGSFVMWGMLLLELPTVILLTVLYYTGQMGDEGWVVLLLVIGLMTGTLLLLMNIRLKLRIDSNGLAFQNPPFLNKWKKINPEEIESLHVKKSYGMMEYGGVGVRFSRKTNAYLFLTDHILIVQTRQKKYVFSTKRPKEIEDITSTWNLKE